MRQDERVKPSAKLFFYNPDLWPMNRKDYDNIIRVAL